jgi:hypothetical protein
MAGEHTQDHVLPQVDFELEQLSVVVLTEGPRRHEYGREEAQRLTNEHVQYTIGLVIDGHLLHAGALIADGSDPTLTGLGFSRLTADELRPLIANDPAVIAGMEAFRIVTYSFPKGGIEFPNAAAPQEVTNAVQ